MWRTSRCADPMSSLIALAMIALLTAGVAPASAVLSMKACELVTLADVQKVLGGGYAPRDLTENENMSICGYRKGWGNAVTVTLNQESYDSASYLKTEQASSKPGTVTPLEGLGAGAFYYLGPDAGNGTRPFQLHFGKGNRLVILEVVTDGKPNIEAARKLAAIAYPKLRSGQP